MSTTIEIPPGECIDGYLRNNRPPGTTYVLGVGNYTTRGCFDFPEHDLCMLAPECRLIGAGSDKTFLDGSGAVVIHEGKPTGYSEILTGGARSKGVSQAIAVEGLTIRVDEFIPCLGLHLWTSQARVSDVVVRDLWGAREHTGYVNEGFGILINNSAGKPEVDGGHITKDCSVFLADRKTENYATALFIGCVAREIPMLRSVIHNCLAVSEDGHAGFAMNDRTTISNCEAVGFRRAVFVDTGPMRDCLVEGLDASRVCWAFDLRGVGERRGIVVRNSTFDFRPIDGWAQGMLVADDESGVDVFGLHVEGCTFIAPAVGRASKARLRGKKVADFTEARNVWIGKWEAPIIQNR